MRSRVLTALVAIPVVLGAVFCTHPIPIVSLCTLVFALGTGEFFGLNGKPHKLLVALSTVLFSLLATAWLLFQKGFPDFVVLLIAACMGVLSIGAGFKDEHSDKRQPLFLVAEAFGWIGAPLVALVLIHRNLWAHPQWYFPSAVLMILIPLWGGDTAGIFVGMAMGKHKLAPSISPKKTVEGAVANLAAAVLLAWGVGHWLGMPLSASLFCGSSVGVFGQAGDLFESWLKRRVGVKDSGTFFPGHGGVLDRIDSLLFATLPTVLLMYLS